MHSKGTFCPAVGLPGDHPPSRKVLRSGCTVLHPAAKVERFSKSNQSRTKVETLPESKGHPLPESRMILRKKISAKVELGLHYALLFHDSGIYPVFLLIPHVVLLQARAFHPKSGRAQGLRLIKSNEFKVESV